MMIIKNLWKSTQNEIRVLSGSQTEQQTPTKSKNSTGSTDTLVASIFALITRFNYYLWRSGYCMAAMLNSCVM